MASELYLNKVEWVLLVSGSRAAVGQMVPGVFFFSQVDHKAPPSDPTFWRDNGENVSVGDY